MKIALVISSLAGGGAERVSTNLVNGWVESGLDVTLITLAATGSDAYPLDERVHRIGLDQVGRSASKLGGLLANISRVRRLRSSLRSVAPDVVVSMTSRVNVLTIIACAGIPCRTVVSERVHPPTVALGRLWEFGRRITYPRADTVVALTELSAEWIRDQLSCTRVQVIPNASVANLPSREPMLKPGDWLAEDTKLLLAVGRLDRQKGFDVLIDVLPELFAREPAWQLVILGEGPLREMLVAQADSLGLGDRVLFPGWAGNLSDWYRRADLFVLSSRFEGFPAALGEAMAHGVAVVSFDCETGPADYIRDGIDGRLVPAGDSAGLGCALAELMSDDDRRSALAAQALEVVARYSTDSVDARWREVLGV